jgi:hypothetical protein
MKQQALWTALKQLVDKQVNFLSVFYLGFDQIRSINNGFRASVHGVSKPCAVLKQWKVT